MTRPRILRSRVIGAALLVVSSSCAAVPGSAARAHSSAVDPGRPSALFSLLVGSRSLDDEEAWEEIEEPFVLGFEGGTIGNPVGFEAGLSFAGDSTTVSGVDVSDTFLEASLGARALFGNGPLFPYVGVGAAYVLVDVEGESGGISVSDDDGSVGFYGHGGLLYRVGRRFFLGFDARLVTGTSVEVFGIDTDADYTQLAVVLGWGG